ncbi:MAG: redoxin family protein [Flavobacteriaceae bacterium]|nr:redoxin family protein [Flavobacteriaceae bacterium]
MIKKIAILILLISFGGQAQHSLSGELTQTAKADWLILYKVEGGSQSFVANTTITDKHFSFKLKKEATSGIYRLFFQMDKQKHLDFIYNNEDIVLSFDPNNPLGTVIFQKSKENNLFKKYTENIAVFQSKLDSIQMAYFQTSDAQITTKLRKDYAIKLKVINDIQQQFETMSKTMLTYHFIKASKRYNAALPFKKPEQYLTAIKKHFFDAVDFNNASLLKSTLITDRIVDYIFYVNISADNAMQERLYKNSVAEVFKRVSNKKLRKELTYYLIKRFSAQENKALTLFMFDEYFNKLPKEDQDLGFKEATFSKLKIMLNAKAPNITWQDFSGNHSLYALADAKYYLVLFWSATCSHCLHEVPLLYAYLKDKKDIKVIAVGLESNPNPWNMEISKYPNFIHVYGKNKWQNKFSRAYDIHATPTYIILDAHKRIVAKPYGEADVKKFFDKLKM